MVKLVNKPVRKQLQYTHIAQYLTKYKQPANEIRLVNKKNFFLQKSCRKSGRKTIPRLFSKKLKLSIFLDQ